jgi:hypothetical protein
VGDAQQHPRMVRREAPVRHAHTLL